MLFRSWKIANEDFFDAPWVNRLNLRASYGVNGNISLSEGPYLILSAGSFNPTTGGVSNGIASFPNNTLRWEKTKTTNVGVDFDVFDNRLGVSLDYYYKKSTDILAPDSTDPTTGTNRMTKNLGAIDNRGIEISLHGTPVRTRDFSWDMIFNMSLNKNKVREYNVNRQYPTSWAYNTPIHAAGYPMFGLFGFRYAGLDNQGQCQIYAPDGTMVPSQATYLLWLDCREMHGCAAELTQYLREHTGLYLSEGQQYGENGSSFIRMNIACSRSRLEDGLKRLAEGARSYEEWTLAQC